MIDDCKNFEKRAKTLEKDEPVKAVELYRQAANCYSVNDKPKDQNSTLEKAAKLLRNYAKSIDDPTEAMDAYVKVSEIYIESSKINESEKVIKEGYLKFEESVKKIRSEVKNIDDPDEVEGKLSLASEYALKAKNEPLSRECWTESGDSFRKSADTIEDPREAFDLYKHAIMNYKKGGTGEKEYATLGDAADNFYKKALNILKTSKQLILAIDNFLQAGTLFEKAKMEDKATTAEIQIQEICDTIGLPIEYISSYLENQGITRIILD